MAIPEDLKMTEKTRIRDASLDDVELVSRSVVSAAHLSDFAPESMYDEEFAEICSREDTLYSYRHARILTVDGVPVGCMVSYPGDIYGQAREITFKMFTDVSQEVSDATGTETFPGEWYLDSLAVLPAHRNSGLGSLLIRDAIETGRRRGYRKFALIVEKSSPDLQQYYSSFGFIPGEDINFFGDSYMRMTLEG